MDHKSFYIRLLLSLYFTESHSHSPQRKDVVRPKCPSEADVGGTADLGRKSFCGC